MTADGALVYAAGVLSAPGARWAVGQPGDAVVVGDWGCTGARSLALLRPATGDVVRFDGWATAGHNLTGVVVTRVPGARRLRVADADRDGCDDLVADGDDGSHIVAVRPATTFTAGS